MKCRHSNILIHNPGKELLLTSYKVSIVGILLPDIRTHYLAFAPYPWTQSVTPARKELVHTDHLTTWSYFMLQQELHQATVYHSEAPHLKGVHLRL